MIAGLRLGDVMDHQDRTCSWPECSADREANGFCRKHGLRVKRGAEPGCETAWDRLVVAALALACAETDLEFDSAALRLDKAARLYRRTRGQLRFRRDP